MNTVVDAATQQPLSKTWIFLQTFLAHSSSSSPQPDAYTITTDAVGHFEIREIPEGQYDLRVSHAGYVEQVSRQVCGHRGTAFTMEVGTTTNGGVLKLARAGTISGHVRDEHGNPLPHITVQALRASYNAVGGRVMNPVIGAATDDVGVYRLFGLAPGRYYLQAEYRPLTGRRMSRTSLVERSTYEPGDFLYSSEYFYPGTDRVTDAAEVPVTPGQEASDIDFSLAPKRVFRVGGKMKEPASTEKLGRVDIVLRPRDDDATSLSTLHFHTIADTEGAFDLRWLPWGAYYLWAVPHSTESNYIARVPVEVREADVEGLSVVLQPETDLTGRITL